MSAIDKLFSPIVVPKFIKVRQKFERPVLEDVNGELLKKLSGKNALASIKKGQKIAITVGSRGISNMPALIKKLVEEVKQAGADPFLVPAMGSHGGASGEGQKKMCVNLGYAEEYIGAPIYSSMEAVEIGRTSKGFPVYFDKYALEADGTIVVNRIKPHTSFRGAIESGIIKMIVIGLGKQKGADVCHDLGVGEMAQNVIDMASISLAKGNILFSVGVIENAYHETCRVEVMMADEIMSDEPGLQADSKLLIPKLYFKNVDAVIIDEIGKNISGTGFDTNVVGRYSTSFIPPDGPNPTRLVILDITKLSHGNANGLGMADFTTKRAFEKVSFEDTYPNAITTTTPITVKIPMVLKNDKQAFQACVKSCNRIDKENATIIRIKNTIFLDVVEVSENLAAYTRGHDKMEIISDPYDLPFDEHGNLF